MKGRPASENGNDQRRSEPWQYAFEHVCDRIDDSSCHTELTRLLDSAWRQDVQGQLASEESNISASTKHLLIALDASDSPSLPSLKDDSPFQIGLDVLESRLRTVRQRVRDEGKTKDYKSTFGQLTGPDVDQVHSSLFEVAVLHAVIQADVAEELYPKVDTDGRNVDIKIAPAGQDIYCECTARGFSSEIDHREGAIDPRYAPEQMIAATLEKKCGPGGQLGIAANAGHPTVLFTCVGFDVLDSFYVKEIENAVKETNCSAVFVFDRYHCDAFTVVSNSDCPFPLQRNELQVVQKGLKQWLGSTHLSFRA